MNILLPNISIWTIVKIFASFAFLLYIIFSVVVVRQVQLMINTLKVGFEGTLRLLAWAHLAFAIIVFLFALLI